MLIEIILFLLIGVLAGTFTGLIPGIHINIISILLISISYKLFINPIYSIVFIAAMATTHTFIDFIPSIFLGCPDTDTELSILPGHEMLKNKKGYEAVYLSNIGSLLAVLMIPLLILPSIFLMKNYYSFIQNFIPYILIGISLILILTDKYKFRALFVFLLTGILGYTTSFLSVKQSLLPLLTGLFGISSLFISIKNNTKIPEQTITKPNYKIKKPLLKAILTAPICSFLPGMGTGQAATLASSFSKPDKKEFLILLGIINTLVMAFSFITLFAIEKTRTGAAFAIGNLINSLEAKHLFLIILIVLISGLISFFLTNFLAKESARIIQKINYKKLSITIIISLILVNFLISGFLGILILISSSLIGFFSIKQKVRRTQMMGVLIIPTIIWFLF